MARLQPKEVRDINYTSKDFDSIKRDILSHIKRYFPNEFQDFNEASGGMAILEALAYIGDQLSYHIDQSVNETFLERAIEEKNILANARMLGYEPKFSIPARVNLSISATLNTTTSANELFVLEKGAKVTTNFNPPVTFETVEEVDFSSTTNRTVNADNNGFTVVSVSSVSAVAGQLTSFRFTVGESKNFLKITLPDRDISEIVSVSADNNDEYTQVRNLTQETIFVGDNNSDSSSSADTPYVLKLKRIPNRYIVEKEPNAYTSLVFGGGTLSVEDVDIIPNPEDFVLNPTLRGSVSGFLPDAIDPSNFLNTKTLGKAPSNVTITVNYRFGGGLNTNVGSRTITSFLDKSVRFKSLDAGSSTASTVDASLSVTNREPAFGGKDKESLNEIKRNANSFFATQSRAVTLQDYQVRVFSLPSKFGSVFRSFARKDPDNQFGVQLILMSQNGVGQLIPPSGVLKNNIETYLREFKSFSDTVRISDGNVINIGVEFSIVPNSGVNDKEALLKSILKLRQLFDVSNSNFNDFISISDMVSELQNEPEIRSVPNFKIINRTGTIDGLSYSNYSFNVQSNTSRGILSFPSDACWEMKFPNKDIIGRIE